MEMSHQLVPFCFKSIALQYCHARIQNFLSEGAQFFFVGEGREEPNTNLSGPSSARQRNDVYGSILNALFNPRENF